MGNADNGEGTRWRLQAASNTTTIEVENQGTLDEFVLDDWLHVEHMDGKQWWLRVGDIRLWVSIDEAGNTQVDVERGCYSDVNGDTKVPSVAKY
jgi:hypothetical protein